MRARLRGCLAHSCSETSHSPLPFLTAWSVAAQERLRFRELACLDCFNGFSCASTTIGVSAASRAWHVLLPATLGEFQLTACCSTAVPFGRLCLHLARWRGACCLLRASVELNSMRAQLRGCLAHSCSEASHSPLPFLTAWSVAAQERLRFRELACLDCFNGFSCASTTIGVSAASRAWHVLLPATLGEFLSTACCSTAVPFGRLCLHLARWRGACCRCVFLSN